MASRRVFSAVGQRSLGLRTTPRITIPGAARLYASEAAAAEEKPSSTSEAATPTPPATQKTYPKVLQKPSRVTKPAATKSTLVTSSSEDTPAEDTPSEDIFTKETPSKPAPAPASKYKAVAKSEPPPKPASSSTKPISPSTLFASPPSRPAETARPRTIAERAELAERIASSNVDWTASYHGISMKPVTQEQYQKLMAPLANSDIEVKPDGVIYLPEIKYRRRLNEAFGPMGWGLIPRGEAVVGASIVTREYALIVDGRFVSQAQGENTYFSPEQLPSSIEGCKSNALMRCCKDLGIASELWDPIFIRHFRKGNMEQRWVEHTTTKKKRQMWFRRGVVEVAYPFKLS